MSETDPRSPHQSASSLNSSHMLSPVLQLLKASVSSAPTRPRTHSSSPCSSWEISSGLGKGGPVGVRAE